MILTKRLKNTQCHRYKEDKDKERQINKDRFLLIY